MKPAQKPPMPKRDYLALTAIALLVFVLASSIFIWWNPSSLPNTISTAATSILYSLLFPPLALFGVFFTILMLVDSWRKNYFIWFLFILLGPGIIALLYFLVQKPKLPEGYFRPIAWMTLALCMALWLPPTFVDVSHRISSASVTKPRPTGKQVNATVISKNLTGYTYKGQTICREMTLDNKYYIELVGGTLVVPKDHLLRFNYSLSATSGGQNRELISGNQSYEGPSTPTIHPIPIIDVPSIIGGPAEIDKNLTSCQLEFWSTANN